MAVPPLHAHRLGRAYAPDSSATALAGALAAGADGISFHSVACATAAARGFAARLVIHADYTPEALAA
jgi:hypothetical protein